MLKTLLTLILSLAGACLLAQDYSFVEAKTGNVLEISDLARILAQYDIVFFGEWHDDSAVHEAQRELLAALYACQPRLLLSFEMFERDTQSALDAYLAGQTSEEQFLAVSRPWPNYASDYRPLIEFAKAQNLACLAANVPRRLARAAAQTGKSFLDSLSIEDRDWVARQVSAPPGRYRDNFLSTMQANAMHGNTQNEDLYDRLYYAQCVKDDTMAESILRLGEQRPGDKIVHFNGDFHSREFLGTVERVRSRAPQLRLAVLSPHPANEPLPENADQIADFFVLVPGAQE